MLFIIYNKSCTTIIRKYSHLKKKFVPNVNDCLSTIISLAHYVHQIYQ